MLINYIIDQINAHISRKMVEKEDQYIIIIICGIITSSNFWFLSNLGVFFTNGVFTSLEFRNTFYNALPFYKFNLLSTFIFNFVIYGLHNLFTILRNRRENTNKINHVQAPLIPNENESGIDNQIENQNPNKNSLNA